MRKKVLFVCTGNTCRSPMAAALWEKRGCTGFSAGLYAQEGQPLSANAVRTLDRMGCWPLNTRAHLLTLADMQEADAVVGLTEGHAHALRERFPAFAGKITAFPFDIPDPFGGDEEDYLRCAEKIEEGLRLLAEKMSR